MNIKNPINSLNSFYKRVSLLKSADVLGIVKTGFEDGEVYVELENGLKFYGPPTRKKLYKYHKFLSRRLKEIVKVECLNIVYDIIIRYHERGLKIHGPKKELFYTPKEGDIIAEMGAFMGYYTVYLSKIIGENGKIIAIEPIEDNLYYLRLNVEKNKLNNVLIVPKGVWNKPDKMVFYKKEDDHQSASLVLSSENKNKLEFEVDCLDNILNEANTKHVDFMIIQLNGVEYEALEGLNIVKPKNLSIAARYDSGTEKTSRKILNLLENRGYFVKLVEEEYVFAELKCKEYEKK